MELSNKGCNVVWLEEVDSTSNHLKEWLRRESLEEGTTVVADYQTQGRGQRGNGWSSEKGKNLLFSLLLHPKGMPANEQFILSRIASLATKRVLDRFTGDIRIKWPNDIYWREKKIAGILIENDLLGGEIACSVVGIGINVNQQRFPDELPNPVSLRQITGVRQDRVQLLEKFLQEFFVLYGRLMEGLCQRYDNLAEHAVEREAIAISYMESLYRADGYHWYEDQDGRFQAAIQEVKPSGHLVLRTLGESEERCYAFKEVKYVDQ